MRTTTIKAITTVLISISLLGLGGCASGIVDPVPGSPTVADSYEAAMRGQTTFNKANQVYYQNHIPVPKHGLRGITLPNLSHHNGAIGKTLNAQFPKLPNPQSVMYVFGHYAGNGQIPIAGHFVPFSLYTRNYYAMPNEVLSPYNDGQFNRVKGSA